MMDITNEINEKGLQSLVNGEFILLPDSVKPYPGDFFTFNFEGLEDHLFRIDDVQFDRASTKKYYKITYNLYPNNSDEILDNISEKYVLNYDNIGGTEVAVIKKADQETAERTKDLVDSMIKRYGTLFYDEDMDLFVFDSFKNDGDEIHIWSPYLQKFLHDNTVVDQYNRGILTEFYVVDIDQKSNSFFSNLGYRNSFFRKVETQDSNLTFNNSLMSVVMQYNINAIRNLPFGYTAGEYRFADVHSGAEFYFDAFHILEQNFQDVFETLSETHKFVDEAELAENEASIIEGDIVYRVSTASRIIPEDVFKLFNDNYFSIAFNSLMEDLTGTDDYLATQELFTIIRSYLKGTLVLSDDLINQLNEHYFDITFKDYILMPLVIFIVKKLITDAVT